jgi:hypothetical protein
VLPLLSEYFYSRSERLAEILSPFLEERRSTDPFAVPDLSRAARLSGEDLVVALSRLCEGG